LAFHVVPGSTGLVEAEEDHWPQHRGGVVVWVAVLGVVLALSGAVAHAHKDGEPSTTA